MAIIRIALMVSASYTTFGFESPSILHVLVTKTTHSTSCLLNDSHDYLPYHLTYTTIQSAISLVNAMATTTASEVVHYTSMRTSIMAPYSLSGSPENNSPKVIVSIMVFLIFILVISQLALSRRYKSSDYTRRYE